MATLFLLAAARFGEAAKLAPAPPSSDASLISLIFDIVLLRGKLITLCVMCGYALFVALKVRALGPRNAFWGVSFVRTLLGAFGGGIVVPICLGMPPGPMANDMVVTAALVGWYIAQRSPGDLGFRVLGPSGLPTARLLVLLAFETFRANFVISMTDLAARTLKPSLFATPLWGPLLCGAMAGSFGNFLPFDKGLAPIDKGFSWPMISAFSIAALYLALMHEPTIGPAIWAACAPSFERSAETCRVGAVAFLCTVGVLQETLMGPSWHPLQPLTALLSAVVPPVVAESPTKAKAS
ncbi:hypothetical protein KFE25_010148 [Diacronema lutheri]|uniref:Uncharacterized protein n=1 Tax=Diacronema lutheri TaxID=2081491 RepID=A0A8J6CCH0_DIALT|nr:hypothetical protein KFE25_010148 [Diacronema lutheri]